MGKRMSNCFFSLAFIFVLAVPYCNCLKEQDDFSLDLHDRAKRSDCSDCVKTLPSTMKSLFPKLGKVTQLEAFDPLGSMSQNDFETFCKKQSKPFFTCTDGCRPSSPDNDRIINSLEPLGRICVDHYQEVYDNYECLQNKITSKLFAKQCMNDTCSSMQGNETAMTTEIESDMISRNFDHASQILGDYCKYKACLVDCDISITEQNCGKKVSWQLVDAELVKHANTIEKLKTIHSSFTINNKSESWPADCEKLVTYSLQTLITDAIRTSEDRAAMHGDTGFVILSAALVFFMTPGLGYFYSGMARSKNALSLIFICFLCMAVVIVQWTLFGYSLTFSEYGSPFIGDFNYGGGTLLGDHATAPATKIPSIAFFIYQGMFATITPALMFGSSAERVRILPALLFIFIWTTVVYDPIAYWTWAKNGWLMNLGSLDYAGGTPVHIASGFAGLAQALVLGKRAGFEECKEWKPHNLSNVFLGTAILWFGWFGFNGGSALAGTSRAAMAAAVTSIAAATGGLTWVLFDYRHEKKLSALGFCSGAVAALVAITPASGFVAPWAAIVIGFLAGLVCNLCCQVKHLLGYDDALDVFGTHGMGGVLGNILTGIFAQSWIANLDGTPIPGGWVDGNWIQVPYQLAGSAAGASWSFCWTIIILVVMQHIPGLALRLNKEDQEMGVDLAEMGEVAYTMTDAIKAAKRRLSSFGKGSKPTDFNLRPIKEKGELPRDHEQPNHGSLAMADKQSSKSTLADNYSPTNGFKNGDYQKNPNRHSANDNNVKPDFGVLSLNIE